MTVEDMSGRSYANAALQLRSINPDPMRHRCEHAASSYVGSNSSAEKLCSAGVPASPKPLSTTTAREGCNEKHRFPTSKTPDAPMRDNGGDCCATLHLK